MRAKFIGSGLAKQMPCRNHSGFMYQTRYLRIAVT